jgi:hypothetical protein
MEQLCLGKKPQFMMSERDHCQGTGHRSAGLHDAYFGPVAEGPVTSSFGPIYRDRVGVTRISYKARPLRDFHSASERR